MRDVCFFAHIEQVEMLEQMNSAKKMCSFIFGYMFSERFSKHESFSITLFLDFCNALFMNFFLNLVKQVDDLK